MPRYGNEEVAQDRKESRLESFTTRIRMVSTGMQDNTRRLEEVNDRLFGHETATPVATKENLKSVSAGEYDGLSEAIDQLEQIMQRLENEITRTNCSA